MNYKDKGIKLRLSWLGHFKNTGNIAKTCRHFGISRSTFYFWYKRYLKNGKRGLRNLSSRPNTINNTLRIVIKAVIKFRKEKLIGPKKIAGLLARNNMNISYITVYRILKKFKLNKLSKISKSQIR